MGAFFDDGPTVRTTSPPDLFRLEAELLINPEDELQGLGLVLVALAVAALCTWIATDDSDKAEIAELLEGAVSGESEHEEPRGIDWDSLSQEIVAWMEVPSTNISQPVARPDKRNPKAYLYLDALGQGGYGTPYIDADCTKESLLVPIYGRNMSDGSAFADFTKYSEEDYARSHSRIFLHTRDGGTYELSVIAVDVVDASAETVCPSFDDPSAIAEWIGKSDLFCLNTMGRAKYSLSRPAHTRPSILEQSFMRCRQPNDSRFTMHSPKRSRDSFLAANHSIFEKADH